MKKAIFTILGATAFGAMITPNANADATLQSALYQALDDEYRAHSLYEATISKFGEVRPFSNIINAEARHISIISELLQKYGFAVPNNPYNKAQMEKLVPATLKEACEAGVQAEIDNVALYDNKLIKMVGGYEDAKAAFINLRDASELRHLQAFKRCASGKMGQGKGHGMRHGMGGGGMGHGWQTH